jgi:hypothetical protein
MKTNKVMKKALKLYAPEIKSLLADLDKQQIKLTESEISYFTNGYLAGRLKGAADKFTNELETKKVVFPLMNR